MKASFVDTLPAEMFGGTDFWLFSNEWDLLHRKAQSYKVSNKNDHFAHGGISIKLFVVYLHIINECLRNKFHPYSILTGHTKVESVAY